jgi:hypothetical protein
MAHGISDNVFTGSAMKRRLFNLLFTPKPAPDIQEANWLLKADVRPFSLATHITSSRG